MGATTRRGREQQKAVGGSNNKERKGATEGSRRKKLQAAVGGFSNKERKGATEGRKYMKQ